MKEKRFVSVYSQGTALSTMCEVIVDLNTGVNYLFIKDGYGAGLTVLLDSEGKPVVSNSQTTRYSQN